MKRVYLVISTGLLLFILNGCSIFPSPLKVDINYYDIGFPKEMVDPGTGINVMPFQGGVGTEPRMIFRDSSNRIQFDPYNRWSFSPAKLVQRYLSQSFSDEKESKIKFYIQGEVLRFDGDLESDTSNISLKVDIYSIKTNYLISSKTYSVSVPVKEKTATEYAKAMEKGMGQLVPKIASQIKYSTGQ